MQTVICDLDGTLANCEHRQHHVQNGNKNWKAFFAEMDKDTVNENLNLVLGILQACDSIEVEIIFVSARPEDYREVTTTWLQEQVWHVGTDCQLLMRKKGDFRPDTIVKQEILDQLKAEGKTILIAFDDRKSVVDMWRENGVLCAQVADHNF